MRNINMYMVNVNLKSAMHSVYSQGKFVQAEKLPKESHQDYEARTWKERLNCTDDGEVFIPAAALKNCLSECAKYLSIQIPGKGKATYTKHFEAGVICAEDFMLGINKYDIKGKWVHVPSDGTRGGSKRVLKCFPIIPEWKASGQFLVADETVTQDVFQDVLRQAGQFIGIGVYRPRNNGNQGRFEIEKISFSDV